jgi:hypothetical protein
MTLGKENIMPVTGTKKVIKFGGSTGHQFCIDGFLVEEVLKTVPETLTIIGAEVEVGTNMGSRNIPVTNSLKKLGVSRLTQSVPNKRAFIIFDKTTPKIILSKTKEVCRLLEVDYSRAAFRYITLADDNGSAGQFRRTTKEIKPYSEDQRKKLKVLGLSVGHGKVQDVVAKLGAKKYYCDFQEEIVKVAMCRPE